MAINKVQYGNETLIDLTSDTVSPDSLLIGYTATDKSGNKIQGTFDPENVLTYKFMMSNVDGAYVSGTKVTFDITSYPLYSEIDNSIVLVELLHFGAVISGLLGGTVNTNLTKSYDPDTGVVALTSSSSVFNASYPLKANIYILGGPLSILPVSPEDLTQITSFEASESGLVTGTIYTSIIEEVYEFAAPVLFPGRLFDTPGVNPYVLTYQLPTFAGGEITSNRTLATKGKFLTDDIIVNVEGGGGGIPEDATGIETTTASTTSTTNMTISGLTHRPEYVFVLLGSTLTANTTRTIVWLSIDVRTSDCLGVYSYQSSTRTSGTLTKISRGYTASYNDGTLTITSSSTTSYGGFRTNTVYHVYSLYKYE